jgi:hypothetical protein
LVILAIFCSYFGLIIWVSKLLAFSSADEELFSEMAIQDINICIIKKVCIIYMFADKPWLYFQNLFQEEKKLPEKNITANTGKAVKFQKTANIT